MRKNYMEEDVWHYLLDRNTGQIIKKSAFSIQGAKERNNKIRSLNMEWLRVI